ncbi:hypothetical protein NL676_022614 [Syzygium grande]|nr:hypothetical protein NL676_022614 [Syzygium grande]
MSQTSGHAATVDCTKGKGNDGRGDETAGGIKTYKLHMKKRKGGERRAKIDDGQAVAVPCNREEGRRA